jgi:hypothetical protein
MIQSFGASGKNDFLVDILTLRGLLSSNLCRLFDPIATSTPALFSFGCCRSIIQFEFCFLLASSMSLLHLKLLTLLLQSRETDDAVGACA